LSPFSRRSTNLEPTLDLTPGAAYYAGELEPLNKESLT